MKKILILYAKYGGGHYSAANSIKNYIDNHYENAETNIIDCMEYINKAINKLSTDAYKRITTNTPRLWKTVYYKSEKGALSKISKNTNKFMARKLCHLVQEYSPDVIVSTHMFATQMISYLKRKNKITCTLATVLTDFAPHEQWLIGHEYGNYFFVSNDEMRKALVNNFGIDENKVYTTGIPLSEKFSHPFDKDEIFNTFGLDCNKKTILFFGGGELGIGKDYTVSILHSLTKHLNNYQIIAVSGKNKKLNDAFIDVANQLGNPKELKIFDYITNVPEAMSICDLVVTKPGGLTSSECLASSLPMLIINPIPGQEEENAEFLEKSGIAIWLKPNNNADFVIDNLLNSPDLLHKMKENTKAIAHTDSTQKICDIILKI